LWSFGLSSACRCEVSRQTGARCGFRARMTRSTQSN
jgi:hypothetical protein